MTHDYDVEALGLSSPPASAVVSSYRPAVSVRNNGVHDALASGYVRIYAADLLIFETEVYSGTIAPGDTGPAQGVDYWTPPAEGKYMIFGYVSCPLDQYEPNNNLAPVTITVSGAPPPPPTPVTPHAAQHEEGGADEVNIDGLKGLTADLQVPRPHAAGHQAGGPDQINVGALLGELAQDQPGKVHSNTKHDPVMATQSALTSHQNAVTVHTAATNLANRETTGPLTGRVPQAQVHLGTALPEDPSDNPDAMGLRFDRNMGYCNPAHHAYKHGPTGHDPTALGICIGESILIPPMGADIARIDIPEAWLTDDMVILLQVLGHLTLNPGGVLQLSLMSGAASWCSLSIPGLSPTEHNFVITAWVLGAPADKYSGALEYRDYHALTGSARHLLAVKNADVSRPATDKAFTIRASPTGGIADSLICRMSFSRSIGSTLIPIP